MSHGPREQFSNEPYDPYSLDRSRAYLQGDQDRHRLNGRLRFNTEDTVPPAPNIWEGEDGMMQHPNLYFPMPPQMPIPAINRFNVFRHELAPGNARGFSHNNVRGFYQGNVRGFCHSNVRGFYHNYVGGPPLPHQLEHGPDSHFEHNFDIERDIIPNCPQDLPHGNPYEPPSSSIVHAATSDAHQPPSRSESETSDLLSLVLTDDLGHPHSFPQIGDRHSAQQWTSGNRTTFQHLGPLAARAFESVTNGTCSQPKETPPQSQSVPPVRVSSHADPSDDVILISDDEDEDVKPVNRIIRTQDSSAEDNNDNTNITYGSVPTHAPARKKDGQPSHCSTIPFSQRNSEHIHLSDSHKEGVASPETTPTLAPTTDADMIQGNHGQSEAKDKTSTAVQPADTNVVPNAGEEHVYMGSVSTLANTSHAASQKCEERNPNLPTPLVTTTTSSNKKQIAGIPKIKWRKPQGTILLSSPPTKTKSVQANKATSNVPVKNTRTQTNKTTSETKADENKEPNTAYVTPVIIDTIRDPNETPKPPTTTTNLTETKNTSDDDLKISTARESSILPNAQSHARTNTPEESPITTSKLSTGTNTTHTKRTTSAPDTNKNTTQASHTIPEPPTKSSSTQTSKPIPKLMNVRFAKNSISQTHRPKTENVQTSKTKRPSFDSLQPSRSKRPNLLLRKFGVAHSATSVDAAEVPAPRMAPQLTPECTHSTDTIDANTGKGEGPPPEHKRETATQTLKHEACNNTSTYLASSSKHTESSTNTEPEAAVKTSLGTDCSEKVNETAVVNDVRSPNIAMATPCIDSTESKITPVSSNTKSTDTSELNTVQRKWSVPRKITTEECDARDEDDKLSSDSTVYTTMLPSQQAKGDKSAPYTTETKGHGLPICVTEQRATSIYNFQSSISNNEKLQAKNERNDRETDLTDKSDATHGSRKCSSEDMLLNYTIDAKRFKLGNPKLTETFSTCLDPSGFRISRDEQNIQPLAEKDVFDVLHQTNQSNFVGCLTKASKPREPTYFDKQKVLGMELPSNLEESSKDVESNKSENDKSVESSAPKGDCTLAFCKSNAVSECFNNKMETRSQKQKEERKESRGKDDDGGNIQTDHNSDTTEAKETEIKSCAFSCSEKATDDLPCRNRETYDDDSTNTRMDNFPEKRQIVFDLATQSGVDASSLYMGKIAEWEESAVEVESLTDDLKAYFVSENLTNGKYPETSYNFWRKVCFLVECLHADMEIERLCLRPDSANKNFHFSDDLKERIGNCIALHISNQYVEIKSKIHDILNTFQKLLHDNRCVIKDYNSIQKKDELHIKAPVLLLLSQRKRFSLYKQGKPLITPMAPGLSAGFYGEEKNPHHRFQMWLAQCEDKSLNKGKSVKSGKSSSKETSQHKVRSKAILPDTVSKSATPRDSRRTRRSESRYAAMPSSSTACNTESTPEGDMERHIRSLGRHVQLIAHRATEAKADVVALYAAKFAEWEQREQHIGRVFRKTIRELSDLTDRVPDLDRFSDRECRTLAELCYLMEELNGEMELERVSLKPDNKEDTWMFPRSFASNLPPRKIQAYNYRFQAVHKNLKKTAKDYCRFVNMHNTYFRIYNHKLSTALKVTTLHMISLSDSDKLAKIMKARDGKLGAPLLSPGLQAALFNREERLMCVEFLARKRPEKQDETIHDELEKYEDIDIDVCCIIKYDVYAFLHNYRDGGSLLCSEFEDIHDSIKALFRDIEDGLEEIVDTFKLGRGRMCPDTFSACCKLAEMCLTVQSLYTKYACAKLSQNVNDETTHWTFHKPVRELIGKEAVTRLCSSFDRLSKNLKRIRKTFQTICHGNDTMIHLFNDQEGSVNSVKMPMSLGEVISRIACLYKRGHLKERYQDPSVSCHDDCIEGHTHEPNDRPSNTIPADTEYDTVLEASSVILPVVTMDPTIEAAENVDEEEAQLGVESTLNHNVDHETIEPSICYDEETCHHTNHSMASAIEEREEEEGCLLIKSEIEEAMVEHTDWSAGRSNGTCHSTDDRGEEECCLIIKSELEEAMVESKGWSADRTGDNCPPTSSIRTEEQVLTETVREIGGNDETTSCFVGAFQNEQKREMLEEDAEEESTVTAKAELDVSYYKRGSAVIADSSSESTIPTRDDVQILIEPKTEMPLTVDSDQTVDPQPEQPCPARCNDSSPDNLAPDGSQNNLAPDSAVEDGGQCSCGCQGNPLLDLLESCVSDFSAPEDIQVWLRIFSLRRDVGRLQGVLTSSESNLVSAEEVVQQDRCAFFVNLGATIPILHSSLLSEREKSNNMAANDSKSCQGDIPNNLKRVEDSLVALQNDLGRVLAENCEVITRTFPHAVDIHNKRKESIHFTHSEENLNEAQPKTNVSRKRKRLSSCGKTTPRKSNRKTR